MQTNPKPQIIYIQGERERMQGIHYEVESNAKPLHETGIGKVIPGVRVDECTGATLPVAIIFVYDGLPMQAINRLQREAMIHLHNANLIEIYGFVEIDEENAMGGKIQRYHIVCELLDGVLLSDLFLEKCTNAVGEEIPFADKMLSLYRNNPEHFAQIIATNVLSGLAALHDAGYIHCDIDPSNVMLTTDGHIKLISYGISKLINDIIAADNTSTMAGVFMGQSTYASPELILGDIRHQNQTTDVYGVGILLYQCVTGHVPFKGSHIHVMENQLKTPIPTKDIKNRRLRTIISKACSKRQENRYQTAGDMCADLESVVVDTICALPTCYSPKIKNIESVSSNETYSPLTKTNGNTLFALFKKTKDLILGHHSKNTLSEQLSVPEQVNSSIFAPSETKRGDYMMVQVFLYKDGEERAVACKATEVDPEARRQNYTPLSVKLKSGDRVKVTLKMSGKDIEVEEPQQEMIWQGHYMDCQFGVLVNDSYKLSTMMGTVMLSVNGIPCGRMMFKTKIVDRPQKLYAKIESKSFQKIFISYSHLDESKVKYIAEAYRAQGVDYFFDRHYLKAGDVYPVKIMNYINSADLFILCWSKNAEESDYVQLERNQALSLAYPQKDMKKATLSIHPISIDPKADLPEDMNNVYNFGEV